MFITTVLLLSSRGVIEHPDNSKALYRAIQVCAKVAPVFRVPFSRSSLRVPTKADRSSEMLTIFSNGCEYDFDKTSLSLSYFANPERSKKLHAGTLQ